MALPPPTLEDLKTSPSSSPTSAAFKLRSSAFRTLWSRPHKTMNVQTSDWDTYEDESRTPRNLRTTPPRHDDVVAVTCEPNIPSLSPSAFRALWSRPRKTMNVPTSDWDAEDESRTPRNFRTTPPRRDDVVAVAWEPNTPSLSSPPLKNRREDIETKSLPLEAKSSPRTSKARLSPRTVDGGPGITTRMFPFRSPVLSPMSRRRWSKWSRSSKEPDDMSPERTQDEFHECAFEARDDKVLNTWLSPKNLKPRNQHKETTNRLTLDTTIPAIVPLETPQQVEGRNRKTAAADSIGSGGVSVAVDENRKSHRNFVFPVLPYQGRAYSGQVVLLEYALLLALHKSPIIFFVIAGVLCWDYYRSGQKQGQNDVLLFFYQLLFGYGVYQNQVILIIAMILRVPIILDILLNIHENVEGCPEFHA